MTDWTDNIREFLNKKMAQRELSVVALADCTGVALTTMRGILTGNRRPEIKNIVKIADYFNCSIDEMLGRSDFPSSNNKQYVKLSLEELSINLRNFIKGELEKRGLNQYQLGRNIGRSDDAIRHFLRENV
jgi:DNA-binding XRE family transcriptional regulator